MYFSKPLLLISFCFLFHTALCAETYLFHFCSTSQNNYTSSSPYGSNLDELAHILYAKVPPTGFGLDTIGQDPNRVNGLALCRGDVPSSSCKTCVLEASKEIRVRCPDTKGATIWYDNCLFKYSSEDFFGVIDNANKFYLYNVQDVSSPIIVPFNQRVKGLLSGLADSAYASPLLFATGELQFDQSKKLYGLVQCTRDLSGADCKKCLYGAISELPSCCDGKRGGRVVGGSCNFRYELYPFVNSYV